MKLSVTILTFNESHNIQACLESVKWADEIIVVDSYSEDDTLEIARQYTDKVFQVKWLGYSGQRNWSLQQVTGDWVLVLDADERVTPQLHSEIAHILQEGGGEYDGYYITRDNYFMGRPLKSSPDSHIRLFRAGKGVYCDREVHEVALIDGPVGQLKGILTHYTYRDLEQYIAKMNRYSTLGAKEMLKSGKQPSLANLIFRAVYAFVRHYLIQRGFIDGTPGFVFSVSRAYYTFCKYAKLYEMFHKRQ